MLTLQILQYRKHITRHICLIWSSLALLLTLKLIDFALSSTSSLSFPLDSFKVQMLLTIIDVLVMTNNIDMLYFDKVNSSLYFPEKKTTK